MTDDRRRCEIGVMCEGREDVEVVQEAQIAGDLWVPVCRECAAALTLLRKQALTGGNGGEVADDEE